MPGHVTELVRAGKRQPAPVSEVLALGVAPPASPERRREVMAMVRELADKKSVEADGKSFPSRPPREATFAAPRTDQAAANGIEVRDITEPIHGREGS
jgi:hypothetical protein